MNSIAALPDVDIWKQYLEKGINEYLDERESVLFDDIELDIEILREVTALLRVVQSLRRCPGVQPMPTIIKRVFYLKREIIQTHRHRLHKKRFTSRAFLGVL